MSLREDLLKVFLPQGWNPRYGDFIVYAPIDQDRKDSDGIAICLYCDHLYILAWAYVKGGWEKIPLVKAQCRPVTQKDYPLTSERMNFYKFYRRMMDVSIQAEV